MTTKTNREPKKENPQKKPLAVSSFHLYKKPKELTLSRCQRIVKYGRKRLRGEDNNSLHSHDNTSAEETVPVVTHSQIELGRLLGKGAFSSVYSIESLTKTKKDGEELSLGEDQCNSIVVKFLRTKLYDNHGLFAASAADLVKEGNILSTLQHSNVIRLHAVSSRNGVEAYLNGYHDSYFLVLERLEQTLADRIDDWQSRHKQLYESDESSGDNDRRAAFASGNYLLGPSSTKNSWRQKISDSFRIKKRRDGNTLEISERTTSTHETYYTPSEFGDDLDDDDIDDSCIDLSLSKLRLLDERLDVAQQLADAVAYLHSEKVIHRDLKPDNIGFDRSGVLKVFDFDIARVVPCGDEEAEDDSRDAVLYQASSLARKKKKAEDVTFLMTQKVGSPRYMAPEIARQESYNLKADVYSFAVLAHQILTLEKPYEDISDEDYDECVFYKGVRPNIPSGLPISTKNLLRRAWSHRISQRPNMEAVREALTEQRSEILRLGTIGRILPPTAGFGSTAYVGSCAFESVSDNNKKLKPAKNTRSSVQKSRGKKSTSKVEPPKNKKTKQKGLLSNLFKNKTKTKKVPHPGVFVSETSGGHRRRQASAQAA
eukprot:CAMPEP_0201124016 /NCGR_PEP_ID=MMETSP0850-20130426/9981_1 /ASSEMBLY_ACC=CAM_ASM_000622 /TAXON_ID=183588 /ORGANISM="Pseudo-nitzschia fraudulenta, Strain WWA7" /LENGTH=598 /DNA_ID=CAMNT_0047391179 /DNA_START=222 /DNA_END=2018 /DNA_ORIENTATION=-